MTDLEPTALEERLARHLAANDWIIDKGATSPWENRSAEFRNDYVTYAREVLAIVGDEDGKAKGEVVAALQEKAQELSEQAESEMRRDLEEQAQVWHEAAELVRKLKASAGEPS
ncbi:hypothetical protein AB0I27_22375 [Streptomyces sp. NPDC050597]|uniref:hypothetical protein n=1 Tax=Streptomyces sp. NPDC050597 TaxID=3157212 RepID=UPI003443DC9C